MSSFLGRDKAIITSMVIAETPERVLELMEKSAEDGADAFGLQTERLKPEYRNKEVYKKLFSYGEDMPKYITNYRGCANEGKTDETIAKETLEMAEMGHFLIDVVGDLFDRQPGELSKDKEAVKKQEEYIKELKKRGSEVLISSHVMKFMPGEKVLEMALEHKRRGADISKIVAGAESEAEQAENIKTVALLREKLGIPFLFLSVGKCNILRRTGGELGCCMYLCVHEHDKNASLLQPLITEVKNIRENMGWDKYGF